MPKNLRPRQRTNLVANSRWAAYATAGAATAMVGINSAEADIHYVGPLNVPVNGSPTDVTYYFNPSPGNSSALFALHHNGTFAGLIVLGANSGMFRGSVSSPNGNFRYPSRLGSGVNVSAGPFVANRVVGTSIFFATLASNFGSGYGNWRAAGTGFIGVKFNGGGGTQYGWIRITMDGSAANNTFTLVDYAWADVGQSIMTGQVPEAGSLGLLAVGAAGLLLWRRQPTKAA